MEKQLKFQCWQCDRVFTLLKDIEGQPSLIVECTFCAAEAEVDLAPYRETAVSIQKSIDLDALEAGEFIDLPDDALPTTPIKAK